jgi:hypothetical protein
MTDTRTAAKTTKPVITEDCPKCSGKGRIAAYSGIHGGVCFTCEGRGTVTILASSAKARRTRQARAAAKANAARWAGREDFTIEDFIAHNAKLVAEGRAFSSPEHEVRAWAIEVHARKESELSRA